MSRQSSSADAVTTWTRFGVSVTETGEGEPICLALANTRNWRRSPAPLERLNAYADLLRWIEAKRVVDAAGVAALAAEATARPRAASRALAGTIALRDAVYRLFSERAHGRALPPRDLGYLIGAFNEAVARVGLVLEEGRLAPRLRGGAPDLDIARLQAALSAVALLTRDRDRRVKECADDRGCGWLFVDTTRNASRRFCFSNECGNRARQAAFRRRHRAADARAGSRSVA
jgi:predicted RNA-binding Zn ribbon-like protein